jgi:molybdopterin-guanine dinucleotide biosynthesis protein A
MTGPATETAYPRPSVIVLAGGQSSRFGVDKLAADVGGRPLLHHAIEAVAGICCEVIVVVGAAGVPPLPGGLTVPIRIARDDAPGGGPLIGVIAGLEESRAPTVVVVGGDMPALVPEILVELDRRLHASPLETGAVALRDGDRARPLPCAVRREPALAAASQLREQGRARLRDLLTELAVETIPETDWRRLDPEGRSLLDVDRPEDIALIAKASARPAAR